MTTRAGLAPGPFSGAPKMTRKPRPEYTDEDLAHVGRALMERLPDGYSYLDCPTEIVTDLENELFDLKLDQVDLTAKLKAMNQMFTEGALREGNLLVENDRLRAALQAFVEIPDLSADISESWALMTAAFAGAKAALAKPEGGRQ